MTTAACLRRLSRLQPVSRNATCGVCEKAWPVALPPLRHGRRSGGYTREHIRVVTIERFRQRGAGLSTVDKGRERERQRGAELVHGGQKVGGGRALTGVHTDQPLIGGRPVPIGRYELRFAVGKYFAARGVPLSDPPFLDDIPLRFSVGEPEGYLHVPLLVTPWSYATYRGS